MHSLERNEVSISGTIFRKEVLDRTAFLTVTTGTYYKDGKRMFTSPTAVFTGKQRCLADGFDAGDAVDIHACLVSVRKKDPSGRMVRSQSICADSIKHAKSIFEDAFGIKSSFGVREKNEVILSGSVYSIEQTSDNVIRIVISVPSVKSGRRMRSCILCTYFSYDAEGVMRDIRTGDKVCAIGAMRTRKTVRDGRPFKTDQIVLRELQKL